MKRCIQVFMVIVYFLFPYGISAEAIVINEIQFNPSQVQDDDGEFIELYNEGSKAVDLTGYTMGGVSVNMDGTILYPGDFLILASEAVDDADTDTDSFESIYGNGDLSLSEFTFPVIDYSGSLSNSGETITLYNPAGNVIDSFNYISFIGSGADGGGFSLERIDPLAPSIDSNFMVSTIPGGTPGMGNSVAVSTSSGVASVPEPSTLLLMVFGLFLIICHRVSLKRSSRFVFSHLLPTQKCQ